MFHDPLASGPTPLTRIEARIGCKSPKFSRGTAALGEPLSTSPARQRPAPSRGRTEA